MYYSALQKKIVSLKNLYLTGLERYQFGRPQDETPDRVMQLPKLRVRDREFVIRAVIVADIYLHLPLVGPDRYAVAHIPRSGYERPPDRYLDSNIRRR